jgi:integrase
MTIRTSMSKRDRKRTLTCGTVISQPRYVLNFNDPRTGKRRQLFFKREAITRRDSILAAIATNSYSESRSQMTVGGAVEHWLENRRTEVKASTWKTYRQCSTSYIIGPLLIGTPAQRNLYREEGARPEGIHFIDTLGPIKILDLTTGDIRRSHRTLLAEVGSRSANMSKTSRLGPRVLQLVDQADGRSGEI